MKNIATTGGRGEFGTELNEMQYRTVITYYGPIFGAPSLEGTS